MCNFIARLQQLWLVTFFYSRFTIFKSQHHWTTRNGTWTLLQWLTSHFNWPSLLKFGSSGSENKISNRIWKIHSRSFSARRSKNKSEICQRSLKIKDAGLRFKWSVSPTTMPIWSIIWKNEENLSFKETLKAWVSTRGRWPIWSQRNMMNIGGLSWHSSRLKAKRDMRDAWRTPILLTTIGMSRNSRKVRSIWRSLERSLSAFQPLNLQTWSGKISILLRPKSTGTKVWSWLYFSHSS